MARQVVSVCLLASVSLVGCGSEPDLEATARAASDATSPTTFPATKPAVVWVGINTVATRADAGIFGTVTAIAEPRWNSADGKQWDDPASRASPSEFQDVTVSVSRVLFDTAELDVAAGRDIVVRTTPGLSGPFALGDSRLVLLAHWLQPFQDGHTEPVKIVVNGANGNWKVEDGSAIGRGRTVPLDALEQRLLYEREMGADPRRDEGSQSDPLAGPAPPPEWKPTRSHLYGD